MVRAEILDKKTGCTYVKDGTTLDDCIEQFLEMFFEKMIYKVLWYKEVD